MSITVEAAAFKNQLIAHLRAKAAVSVVIRVYDNKIQMQSTVDYIYESELPVKAVDKSDIDTEFAMMLDKSVTLLSNEDDITITKYSDNVVLNQYSVKIPLSVSVDEYLPMEIVDGSNIGVIPTTTLYAVTRDARKFLPLAKALAVGPAPISVYEGETYTCYSNAILITRTLGVFPNIEIPYATFSNVVKGIDAQRVEVVIGHQQSLLMFESKNKDKTFLNYKSANASSLSAIRSRLSELAFDGSYNIKDLFYMDNLYKCYSKEAVTLTFHDKGLIGFSLNTASGKSIAINRNSDEQKWAINISTAQLDLILKLFTETTQVEVYKGDDLICFRTESKRLLLSGMTY